MVKYTISQLRYYIKSLVDLKSKIIIRSMVAGGGQWGQPVSPPCVRYYLERLSNDWKRYTFLAERLRTLKINKELTADPKKNSKNDTIENEFMCNVVIVCHIIYLAFEKFSIHTINILEKIICKIYHMNKN
jgi:hypothetical protein